MYKYVKRCFDIIISLISLIILAIPFLIVAILIKIDSEGPVFFIQKRYGKDNKIFNIIKFRTMYVKAPSDIPTHRLSNSDLYITKLGKFLRRTSIDELPQLINILKNDMSLIGPRPCVLSYHEVMELREKNGSNKIKPGLTGLAQTKGRDLVSNEDKAKMDGDYYKNMSFVLDCKIFIDTIIVVLTRNGIHEGSIEGSSEIK